MNLERMLKRHDAGDYFIHHWIGIIRGCVTARQACRRIERRMTETALTASEDPRAKDGIKKMIIQTNELLADLWVLSAEDFKWLAKIETEELTERAPFDPTGLPAWMIGNRIPGTQP